MEFKFSDSELKILTNFSTINPQMVINPDTLIVGNNSNTMFGFYDLETKYDFEGFGIYDTGNLLSALNALKDPQIDPKDKYIIISDKGDKLKFFTTAKSLIPTIPDIKNLYKNNAECRLKFSLSGDKLAVINKMTNILKVQNIFFETFNKKIKITLADDLDSSSTNTYEIIVEDGIKKNELEVPVKMSVNNLTILPGEYEIEVCQNKKKADKYISNWKNLNGVEYYILLNC